VSKLGHYLVAQSIPPASDYWLGEMRIMKQRAGQGAVCFSPSIRRRRVSESSAAVVDVLSAEVFAKRGTRVL